MPAASCQLSACTNLEALSISVKGFSEHDAEMLGLSEELERLRSAVRELTELRTFTFSPPISAVWYAKLRNALPEGCRLSTELRLGVDVDDVGLGTFEHDYSDDEEGIRADDPDVFYESE